MEMAMPDPFIRTTFTRDAINTLMQCGWMVQNNAKSAIYHYGNQISGRVEYTGQWSVKSAGKEIGRGRAETPSAAAMAANEAAWSERNRIKIARHKGLKY